MFKSKQACSGLYKTDASVHWNVQANSLKTATMNHRGMRALYAWAGIRRMGHALIAHPESWLGGHNAIDPVSNWPKYLVLLPIKNIFNGH